MARPIAETPVLYGADAQRFETISQSTNLTPRRKKNNSARLMRILSVK